MFKKKLPLQSINDQTQKYQTFLHIHTQIYKGLNCQLFDYNEMRQKEKTIEKFDVSLKNMFFFFYLVRDYNRNGHGQNIILERQNQPIPTYQKGKLLCGAKLQQKNNQYTIKILQTSDIYQNQKKRSNHQQSSKSQDEACLIVRATKQIDIQKRYVKTKGIKLYQGLNLRLGKSSYEITKIINANDQQNTKMCYVAKDLIQSDQYIHKVDEIIAQQNEEISCRICYNNSCEQQNFMISSICKCSGSTKLVCYQCLTHYMRMKVSKVSTDGLIKYQYENFKCQICKQPYPKYLQYKDKFLLILPFINESGSYIILKDKSIYSNNSLVIDLNLQQKIKIGRSFTCQVQLQQPSISRCHAQIRKQLDGFYLFDCNSKFGTLVYENEIQFELKQKKRAIQVKNCTIAFQLRTGMRKIKNTKAISKKLPKQSMFFQKNYELDQSY